MPRSTQKVGKTGEESRIRPGLAFSIPWKWFDEFLGLVLYRKKIMKKKYLGRVGRVF